jgi:hypothetical protein
MVSSVMPDSISVARSTPRTGSGRGSPFVPACPFVPFEDGGAYIRHLLVAKIGFGIDVPPRLLKRWAVSRLRCTSCLPA